MMFVLEAVALISLFYIEEDWRGARAWAATKAEWEAKGVSFDPQTYFPPPIPDAENLGAIPLFKMDPDPDDPDHEIVTLTLNRATRNGLPGNDLPNHFMGNWQVGRMPDLEKIRTSIAAAYAESFKSVPPPSDSLAQFEALYPFIAELRSAATTRPHCRFEADHSDQFPGTRTFTLPVSQIKVSKILTLDAILALAEHQPDLALEDIKTNRKLISGVQRDPSLVPGFVGTGTGAIASTAIYDGIALHSWNDAQLAEIQDELARIDYLQNFQFSMRSEAITQDAPNIDFLKNNRQGKYGDIFEEWYSKSVSSLIYLSMPNGWFDENKSRVVAAELSISQTVDPKSRRVYPESADALETQAMAFKTRWDGYAPWNIIYILATPDVVWATSKFAVAQVAFIDETRIACGLERYRLAHGVYPDSLEALVPGCIDEVPHDIMNGEPYHYRVRPDGTFLLYSVGWNQKDDGGKVVFKKDEPTNVNVKEGDWVWPTPQY